jgi:16S rRNA processing protein RimM
VTSEYDEKKRVILGRISGLHGVSGWLKIYSYSRPKENIFSYHSWQIQNPANVWASRRVSNWRVQGKGLLAQVDGIDSRDLAQSFVGSEIAVSREDLPDLAEHEYYWCDLIGLEVINQSEDLLGTVVEIKETGANDVLVVKGQTKYLIPLLNGSVVKKIDQKRGRLLVDWDGEYI